LIAPSLIVADGDASPCAVIDDDFVINFSRYFKKDPLLRETTGSAERPSIEFLPDFILGSLPVPTHQ